jgi:hypothetical protein
MKHEILKMFIVLRMRLLILKTSRNKRQGICIDIITMGKPPHKFGLAMEGNQKSEFWSKVELCLIFIRNTMTY